MAGDGCQEVGVAAAGVEHQPLGMAGGQGDQLILELEWAELRQFVIIDSRHGGVSSSATAIIRISEACDWRSPAAPGHWRSRQSSKPDLHPMRGVVIRQPKTDRPIRDHVRIDAGEGDAAPNAIRIFHRESRIVPGRAETRSRSPATPWECRASACRNAPCRRRPRMLSTPGAVHPSGRAGVPGPAAAPDMRRLA